MSTTKDPSFLALPDWYISLTVGGGAITATPSAKDVTAVRTAAGVYTLTLGNSGIDVGHRTVSVDFNAAAGGFVRVSDTSATVKVITITDSANAALEPTQLTVGIRRLV